MPKPKTEKLYKTYSYRVKDSSSGAKLVALGNKVNTVWNYCNAAQKYSLKYRKPWVATHKTKKQEKAEVIGEVFPHRIFLFDVVRGSSKLLSLPSQVIQEVCKEYVNKLYNSGRNKLRWRSSKGSRRSLGWIPFSNQDISNPARNVILFRGLKLKIWQHRSLENRIKSGNFSQDARGRWYCNLVVEVPKNKEKQKSNRIVGIDLGFKTVAAAVNAPSLDRVAFYRDTESKLAESQRKKRKHLTRNIHAKIKNQRKDALHKYSHMLVKRSYAVFVGDISATWQISKGQGKAVLDMSWSALRNFLKYKSDIANVAFKVVSERYTTQKCYTCKSLTGPVGEDQLRLRQWVCSSCNTHNGRDTNAAKNIALLGCQELELKCSRNLVLQRETLSMRNKNCNFLSEALYL
jgi:putative transposase